MNDKAQVHTVEGFVAASLMVITVMIVTKSSLIVSPQTELTMDVQLKQMATDALEILDAAPSTAFPLNLTQHVAMWNLTSATGPNNSLEPLNTQIHKLLPDVIYNVDFAYMDNTGELNITHVIINGNPVENSVVATRMVTLYNSTAKGNWSIAPDDIKVVEVRLIAWRI